MAISSESNIFQRIQPTLDRSSKAGPVRDKDIEDVVKEQSRKNDHERKERLRNQTHYAAVFLLWVVVCTVAVMFVTWAFHVLAPSEYYYLSEEKN